jgi:ABC-type uncharacterized transport system permease subunit
VIAGTLVPGQLGPVHRAWMWLALQLSKVTTPIFMGVIYYVIITPVGLLLRAVGRNPLPRYAGGASAWVSRTGAGTGDMSRLF